MLSIYLIAVYVKQLCVTKEISFVIVPYRVKTKQQISMISREHHLGRACLFISTYICKKMRV